MWRVFVFLIVGGLVGVPLAHAQYGGDPYTSYADQMVRDHINQRRTEATRRASTRQSKEARRSRSTRSRTTKASPKRRVSASLPMSGQLSLSQDMYSSFGNDDPREFTLEVRLVPIGKNTQPLMRWARFTPSQGLRSILVNNVPVGRYHVSAKVIDGDRRGIPALVGTRTGEPSNPLGGDFASMQTTELVVGKDSYGSRVIAQKGSLWFRPVVKQ